MNRYLFGTVFLTGASVLVLEVAAVRLLSPHYGSSLYVFSSVLTVILAALSIGYWYGGRRADRKHSYQDLYCIIGLSGNLVIALLIAAQLLLPNLSADFSVKTGPLVFSFVLFFIPAFLLGVVSPYIIKLQSLHTDPKHIGGVVGQTFFWGTFGSIAGSIATGFVLIPSLGVHQSILLTGIVLTAIGCVTPYFMKSPLRPIFTVLYISIALTLTALSYSYQHKLKTLYVYHSDGLYSSITVTDTKLGGRPVRIMRRDINNSSGIYLDSDELVFPYAQTALLHETLTPHAERFLLIGGGAYTIPRTLTKRTPELSIDVVEIEPVLYEIGKTYFDLSDTKNIHNHAMDARVFLRNTNAMYDAIFGDAFGTDGAVPFHLTTTEFFEALRSHMNENGVLIMNFIGIPKTTRPSLTGSFIKTITSVFPNTRAFALVSEDLTRRQNIIFVSRNGNEPITIDDFKIVDYLGDVQLLQDTELDLSAYHLEFEYLFTDDRAPVEYLVAKQQ